MNSKWNGRCSIVDLLSEVGCFSHYEDPHQLNKLEGLTLRENSTANIRGKTDLETRPEEVKERSI